MTEIAPRHTPEPIPGYTAVELATRTKHLKDMERDYPNLPYKWIEMIYDWHHSQPAEEVERIVNTGEWEVPGKFSGVQGGVLYTSAIEDPS